MDISRYFDADDGSLPEIVVAYPDPSQVPRAFSYLFECGAVQAATCGGHVWVIADQAERPFAGREDAELVISATVEPFHVVLGGMAGGESQIPDLGVSVFTDSLTFDYQMGPCWGPREITTFVSLLRHLERLGGRVSVPWWDADGERDIRAALGVA
jgi:hypothetical protein